jgi:hypothetical protein
MSVILLTLGILVAAAGTLAIGFGIPINEFTLGTTLIIAGTAALTGGLTLIGLAAVVSELGRLAEALRTRPVARPAARPAEAQEALTQPVTQSLTQPAEAPVAAAGGRPPLPSVPVPPQQRPRPDMPVREARPSEPYPAGPSAVEVSAAAIERLRSSIPRTERPRVDSPVVDDVEEVPPLSPNGPSHYSAQPGRAPGGEGPPAEPRVAAEDRAGGAEASRLDFLFRSRAATRTAAQPQPPTPPENFDSFWPADGRSARNAEPQPRTDEILRQTDYPPAQDRPASERSARERPTPERRPEPATAEAAAILKSGVVDGMAYTLFADGSIEAKLPHGTVRFGSIAELRAHIETNS